MQNKNKFKSSIKSTTRYVDFLQLIWTVDYILKYKLVVPYIFFSAYVIHYIGGFRGFSKPKVVYSLNKICATAEVYKICLILLSNESNAHVVTCRNRDRETKLFIIRINRVRQ